MFCDQISNLGRALLGTQRDCRNAAIVLIAAILSLAPLEISHLICMLLGAGGYLLFQLLQPQILTAKGKASPPGSPTRLRHSLPPRSSSNLALRSAHISATATHAAATIQSSGKPEVRKPSIMPVTAPVFEACGWEAEVHELLRRISPCPEGDTAVAAIAAAVGQSIQDILPDAAVAGFAVGNPLSGTAFGVAVPEVDIVINVTWQAAMKQIQEAKPWDDSETRKLQAQKCIIRTVTDRLTKSGAYKFRRSAFRGTDPRVTMVAPSHVQGAPTLPFNISVNSSSPTRCATLLHACGQLDGRAHNLILLVRRWAKDRGLSHASRGHFSPYIWTLITVYFLQVGLEEDGGSVLPPLATAMALASAGNKFDKPKCQKQVGELFCAFVRFYATQFDWRHEAISVRLGHRAPPQACLPLHIVIRPDGISKEMGPSIEDPFESSSNLGTCSTAASLERLHEELRRAMTLSGSSEPKLSELLEPWAPARAEDQE